MTSLQSTSIETPFKLVQKRAEVISIVEPEEISLDYPDEAPVGEMKEFFLEELTGVFVYELNRPYTESKEFVK